MPQYEVVFSKGIGFRQSPNLDDKAPNVKPAKKGEILGGDVNNGFLELNTGEGLFLPLKAPDGTVLLRQLPEDGGGNTKGKFLQWQSSEEQEPTPAAARPPRPSRDDELAMYDKKYDQKYGRRGPPAANVIPAYKQPPAHPKQPLSQMSPAPLGQMVNSHDRATAYMHEFRDALEDMGVDTRDDPYLNRYAPVGGAVDGVRPGPAASAAARATGSGAGIGNASRERPGSRERVPSGGPGRGLSGGPGGRSSGSGRPPSGGHDLGGMRRPSPSGRHSRNSNAGSESGLPSLGGAEVGGVRRPSPSGRHSRSSLGPSGGADPGGVLALCGALVVSRSTTSGSQGRWREGPANAIVPVKEWMSVKHGVETKNSCSSGRVIDVSDRNVMCMSVLGEKAVLGSADHGLQEVNIRAGQKLRQLYTKRCGHTDWVATVSHCPDGRIVSGGVDSKVCLWNTSGVVCADLTGHMGSISRVRVDSQGRLAISSAYDKTLYVWDLKSKRQAAMCTGHNAPVLDFVWSNDVVASGDRSGIVKLWDTSRAENIGTLKGHKGHITAMLAMPDSDGAQTILTGAQDGHVRVWDLRQKLNTFNMSCHPGGAVNELGVTMSRDPRLAVSAGADGRVLVMEPRSNYKPLFELGPVTQDFIYSMLVLEDIFFIGDGRGEVMCFDFRDGQHRYSLTAGQNATRCMGATMSSLICAGDDGNAVIFDF